MCTADEEIEALAAVYCCDGEFTAVQCHSSLRRFRLNVPSSNPKIRVVFECTVEESYPNTAPRVDVHAPPMTRHQISVLNCKLSEYIASEGLSGQAVLDVVVTWVREHLDGFVAEVAVTKKAAEKRNLTVLYQLDHMRAKSKYTKTLCAWAEQLGVGGRLIFFHRFIFVILHGSEHNVRQFMVQQRTQNVDISSDGQPCKERMMTVLEQIFDLPCSLNDFKCADVSSQADMKIAFDSWNVSDLFHRYFTPHLSKNAIQ